MLAVAGLCLAIAGCGGQPIYVTKDGPPVAGPVALDRVADAQVRDERVGKAGNPESYKVFGRRYYVMRSGEGYKERGYASWYGRKFHGRKTSNGEVYDMYKMTAAHKTLPIPSYVRVTNLENKKQAVVRVNDRGPFHKGRIIDLSYAAAWKLGILKKGTALVEVEVVTKESLAAERAPKATPAVETRPLSEAATGIHVASSPAAADSPAPLPTTAASAYGYYLQAGAFRFADNARLMESRLRQAGLGAIPIRTQRSGDIYRVRLGPYTDQAQLAHDHERLLAMGIRPQTIKPESPSY